MINFRFFNGPTDWSWIKKRITVLRVEDTCGLVAERDGELIGAAIFDNILNNSVQVSLIMESPFLIRHGFIDRVYDFIFNGLKKDYVYALVAENNLRSKRLTRRVGFIRKMNIPDGWGDGVDLIVYELNRKNYRLGAPKLREVA